MDLTPLLILPVVGGYAFSIIWSTSYFRASRESDQRIYFRAVFYAVFLYACAVCVHILLYVNAEWYVEGLDHFTIFSEKPAEVRIWSEPSQQALLVLTFILGPLLAYILEIPMLFANYKFIDLVEDASGETEEVPAGRSSSLAKARQRLFYAFYPLYRLSAWWARWNLERAVTDSDFERLLVRAMFRDMPVMLTLESGKLYVGWVIRALNPRDAIKEVRILPMLSGYRDSETHQVEFTTNYVEVLETMSAPTPDLAHMEPGDFEVVIPCDRIIFSHLFDVEAYLHFQNGSEASQVAAAEE